MIDCPPSLDNNMRALTSSRCIDTASDRFRRSEVWRKIKQVIDRVRMRLNKNLEMCDVIATMYDNRRV
ncbi:MAG: hypothetical protein R2778_10605 [Saprospiraceae bacterium]